MNLLLDFESRSTVDLRKRGAYIYAADPSTEILCCAGLTERGEKWIWFPKLYAAGYRSIRVFGGYKEIPIITDVECANSIYEATTLTAHNAQFERLMAQEILTKRFGWHAIPLRKWRCTAARAAALALPRSLEMVCMAMNLPIQKDREGHKLMLRLCKPQPDGRYIEDTASLIRIGQYCITDVDAEDAVAKALPPLPESEEKIWQLDQRINDNGIGFDREGALALKFAIEEAETRLLAEVAVLTGRKIASARQVAALRAWLKDEGTDLDDLKKNTVKEALAKIGEGKAKRMLEIRQEMSLSSTAKINTALGLISQDNRIRGTLLYHGASTGRWGGKGFQPHNLPRDSYKKPEEVADAIAGFHRESTIKAASKCLRGLIVPQDGRRIWAVDYNAIEARTLAWLADEQSALDVFRKGLDPYKVVATSIFNVSYDQVTKAQRDQSKVPELSCGFGGWIAAFNAMAANLGMEPIPEDRAKEIIIQWRENRPMTVALWRGLEDAAKLTVKTGKAHRCGKIVFGIKGNFLFGRLPSGRMLAYPYPRIELREHPFSKEMKEVVTFMGEDPYTRKWCRLYTYGGRFAENFSSGVARDVLCHGLLTLDQEGYDLILSIHDEIVGEDDQDRIKQIEKLMSTMPPWADGLPMAAEGWISSRYRK